MDRGRLNNERQGEGGTLTLITHMIPIFRVLTSVFLDFNETIIKSPNRRMFSVKSSSNGSVA